MLPDITEMKHIRSRNEDTAKGRVRDKSDENNFLP